MIHFGAASVKRHLGLTNDEKLLGFLTDTAGHLTHGQKELMVKVKLCTQNESRSSHPSVRKKKKTFTGVRDLLKQSQNLDCKSSSELTQPLYMMRLKPHDLRTYPEKFGHAIASYIQKTPEAALLKSLVNLS